MPQDNNFLDHALSADENLKAIYAESGRKVPTEKESLENYKMFSDEIEAKMFLAGRDNKSAVQVKGHWNLPQEPTNWNELTGHQLYEAIEKLLKENSNYENGNEKFPDYITSHPEFQKAMAQYLNISEEEFRNIDRRAKEINDVSEKGKKTLVVGKRRIGILGSAYLHKRHLENIQVRKQKTDQTEFEQKLSDAHKVIKTMESSSTSAPGAKITAGVHFLNPYLAPFVEELNADNLRRIKKGIH